MRFTLLLGLIVLAFSIASAKERRADRHRKYSPFGLKDKRGTDYVPGHLSPGGPPTGYFQPIAGPISSHPSTRSISSYSQHQGFDQSSSPFSLMGSSSHGLSSIGMSLGGHTGQIYSLPGSSLQLSSKSPVSFGFHGLNGLSGYPGSSYMKSIYPSGLQSLSSYNSGSSHGSSMLQADGASYGHASFSLPADLSSLQSLQNLQSHSSTPGGHGYNSPESSVGISGGLVFMDSPHGASLSYNPQSLSQSNREPSMNYHVGLSSGSPDSSSYHLPISSNSYPVESSQGPSKHRPSPVSSAGSSYSSPGSYSFPGTNYGVPSSLVQQHSSSSNPTVHYSPPNSYSSSHSTYNPGDSSDSSSNVIYASPSSSYPSSDYPNHALSYGFSEQQTSSSNISPIQSRHPSGKSYDHADVPKYDTISYSSNS